MSKGLITCLEYALSANQALCPFWIPIAVQFHQQYLSDAKNPNGYCGIGGTGNSCPIGVASADD